MSLCTCGNVADQESSQCGRCQASSALGLDSRAEDEDVERTYRMLVKVWHPDRFQSDPKLSAEAEEKLKNINAAYDYLNSEAGQMRGTAPAHNGGEEPASRAAMSNPSPAVAGKRIANQDIVSTVALRLLFLICVLMVAAVAMVAADAFLQSNRATADSYARLKSQMLYELAVAKNNALNSLEGKWRRKDAGSSAAPAPAAATDASSHDVTKSQAAVDPNAPVPVQMPSIKMPYVTVGLSRDEVAGVFGMPLSSTQSALEYRGAQFYMRNNAVVGWRIDSPVQMQHVRLFPGGHVDPGLKTFTIGSTRNDVIAVQGTPSLLAENKLAYGGSEIFLEGGRVVGWNDNHASIRLHVASH